MSGPEQFVGEMMSNIVGSYLDGLRAGEDLQQKKIDAILSVYDSVKDDINAEIPTALMAALEAARGAPQMNNAALQHSTAEPELAPSSEGVRQGAAAAAAPHPDIEQERGASRTYYTITGELPGVLAALGELFRACDPRGYGTCVTSITMRDDGRYAARVSRANSCE